MLGTDQARHTGAQRDFHWIAPLDGNEPPRQMPASTTEPTTWVFTKEFVCGGMRSLTNRA